LADADTAPESWPRGRLDIWMRLFRAAAQNRAASGCAARQARGTALVRLEQMRAAARDAGGWRAPRH
jgi:hypothetical protein